MASTDTTSEAGAAAAALAVVGMYGDPTVSWSIFIETELVEPTAPDVLRGRLVEAVAANPGCGMAPDWAVLDESDWAAGLSRLADARYGHGRPLVRARCTPDGTRLVVGAHHGAMDGLGVLALVAAATGQDLRSRARGISSAPADRPFVRTCVHRVVEAAWHSPRRFRADRRSAEPGDWLLSAPTSVKVSTALLVAATGAALAEWGAQPKGSHHRLVMAIAASRRVAGAVLTPDRQTAYLRLVDPVPGDVEGTRAALQETAPEPDFPTSRVGGLAPLATRLLQRRLGSTVLISNAGPVEGTEGFRSMAVYPAASGPHGVAIGAMTGGETGMLTLRARRSAFSEDAARQLMNLVRESVERLGS